LSSAGEAALEVVIQLAERTIGIRTRGSDWNANLIRLQSARDAAGCAGWSEFAELLSEQDIDGEAWVKLIHFLTIGETYLFRNKPQMDFLRKQVMPDLIAEHEAAAKPTLRIWSAGCATGEEAYTIAILVQELIPDLDRWRIEITGTDLNTESLNKARAGSYGSWSLRGTDAAEIARHTTQVGGRTVIDDATRAMVTFARLNLADTASFGEAFDGVDLVLCRNVTIYFARSLKAAVARRLYSVLAPGGWLLVGPAEPDSRIYDAFELVQGFGASAYRRPTSGAAAKVSAAAAIPWQAPAAVALQEWSPPPAARAKTAPAKTIEECARAAREAGDAGDYAAARDWCRQAIALQPTAAEPYYLLGLTLAGDSKSRPAIDAFRKAIYLEREFALAYYGLGMELLAVGDVAAGDRAFQSLRQLLRTLPPHQPLRGADGMTAEDLHDLIGPSGAELSA